MEILFSFPFPPLVRRLKQGPCRTYHELHPCLCSGKGPKDREFRASLDYLDFNLETRNRADKAALGVKMLVAKPYDQSSVPGTHFVFF